MPVSSTGYVIRLKKLSRKLTFVVVEAHIESRLQTLDSRASIFEFPASIRASSPLNSLSFDPKPNGPRYRNLLTI